MWGFVFHLSLLALRKHRIPDPQAYGFACAETGKTERERERERERNRQTERHETNGLPSLLQNLGT